MTNTRGPPSLYRSSNPLLKSSQSLSLHRTRCNRCQRGKEAWSQPAHNTYNKVVSRLGAKSTKELDAVMCRRPSAPNPLSMTGQMFNNCRRHPGWWHFEVPMQEILSQCDKSCFNIVFSLGKQSEMLLWLLIFVENLCISEASLHFRRPAPTWSMRKRVTYRALPVWPACGISLPRYLPNVSPNDSLTHSVIGRYRAAGEAKYFEWFYGFFVFCQEILLSEWRSFYNDK